MKLKRVISMLLLCVTAVWPGWEGAAFAAPSAVSAEPIVIMGTDAHTTDYKGIGFETEGDGDDNDIPGTLGIKSLSNSTLPEGGIGVTYTFDVPAAGNYRLTIAASLHTFPQYLSSYAVSVNGGDFTAINASNAGSSEEPNGGFGASNLIGVYKTELYYPLKQGENTVSVYATSLRREGGRVYYFIEQLVFTPIPEATPAQPMGIFTDTEPVRFTLNMNGEIPYTVQDYFGETVLSGQTGADGTLELGTMESGHYALYLNGVDVREFSVVRAPENRRNNDNSPFASDMASVFLVDEADVAGYARAAYLAGIRQIRERMRWGNANPAEGVYTYDSHDAYYEPFAEYGIKILNMYHSAPEFVKQDTEVLPDDLFAAYRFAKDAAAHYEGIINAWEIWNEPDIGFTAGTETADKYASLLKAMSIGYRDSGADVDVALGGIAYEPGAYVEQLMKNDAGKYFDIYNYHVHREVRGGLNVNSYPGNYKAHTQLMEEYDLTEKPVWVTEAGMFIPYENGSQDLTLQQQKTSARYLATSAVEGLASGEELHYWFVFPYYEEGNRNLGSFSSKNTPYASYNAAAAVTDALGNGVYEGRILGLPDGVQGYSFVDGDESIAALWSETAAEVQLLTNTDTAELTNIMGNRSTLDTDGGTLRLEAGPDIVFVRISGRFPSQLIERGNTVEKQDRADTLEINDRIVISQTYPAAAREDAKNRGYKLDKTAETTVSVDVYNFNDVRVAAQIKAKTYGGWSITPDTENLSLAPNSKTTLTFTITSDGSPTNSMLYPVVIGGETQYGGISNSVAYITSDETTERTPDAVMADYTEVDLWQRNAAGGTSQQFTAGADSITLSFNFPESVTDRWAYPTLVFRETQDYSAYDGIVVRVYCDAQTAGSTYRMFLTEESGSSYYTSTGYTLAEGWQQFLIPWDAFVLQGGSDANGELDIDAIASLKAGLNARAAGANTLTLENMGLYTISGNKCAGTFETLVYNDGVLTGTLSAAEIPYQSDTARVVVDGKTYDASLEGNVFSCELPLPAGEYTILACVTDESGTVVNKRITARAEPSGFACGDITFGDSAGNRIYTLRGSDTMKAMATVQNTRDEANTCFLAIAVYDADGRLVNANVHTYQFASGEQAALEVAVEPAGGAYAKAFLWDSAQKPLTAAEVIN